jgi:hypothetical protein
MQFLHAGEPVLRCAGCVGRPRGATPCWRWPQARCQLLRRVRPMPASPGAAKATRARPAHVAMGRSRKGSPSWPVPDSTGQCDRARLVAQAEGGCLISVSDRPVVQALWLLRRPGVPSGATGERCLGVLNRSTPRLSRPANNQVSRRNGGPPRRARTKEVRATGRLDQPRPQPRRSHRSQRGSRTHSRYESRKLSAPSLAQKQAAG